MGTILFRPITAHGQTNVVTWHNDNGRTGANLQETILNTTNVNPVKFGKVFSYPVDGVLYAQPLYVSGVTIGSATHNVVYIATENDSIYAFDADSAALNPNPLWQDKFANPPNVIPIPCLDNDSYCTIYPVVGITGTPVINVSNQTLYAIVRTKEIGSTGKATYAVRLHALNIATGAEQPNSPVTICAAASNQGCILPPYNNVNQEFIAQHQMQRPALILTPFSGTSQGVLYVSFGQDRGWVLAYDAATLALLAVYCDEPNMAFNGKGRGGFWGSGGAVSADSLGNLYLSTADGQFDADTDGGDYGDTVIKLTMTYNSTTSSYQFAVTDYFSPLDQSCRYADAVDLGSGTPMVLPTQPGANPDLLLMAGKGYPCDAAGSPIFLINRDNLGQSSGATVQTLSGPLAGYWGSGAYWQSSNATYVYYSGVASTNNPPAGDNLRSYTLTNGVFAASGQMSAKKMLVGTTPTISANGTSNGIVWAIARQDVFSEKPGKKPAILYAFDATNVSHQLYSSTFNATRDTAGAAVKFTVPTIANGKVYVGTQTEVDVYGLCPCPEAAQKNVAAKAPPAKTPAAKKAKIHAAKGNPDCPAEP